MCPKERNAQGQACGYPNRHLSVSHPSCILIPLLDLLKYPFLPLLQIPGINESIKENVRTENVRMETKEVEHAIEENEWSAHSFFSNLASPPTCILELNLGL